MCTVHWALVIEVESDLSLQSKLAQWYTQRERERERYIIHFHICSPCVSYMWFYSVYASTHVLRYVLAILGRGGGRERERERERERV